MPVTERPPSRHRHRHRRRRRRSARRLVTLAILATVVVGVALGVILTEGAAGRRPALAQHRSTTTTTTTTTTTLPPTTTTTDPGLLPQTDQLPSADTQQFDNEMAELWRGVVSGSVQPALPAFFPETAYEQLKSIDDPAADYADRLVHDYGLDIEAAHGLLGADPADATLVQVVVPSGNAHWVPPGECDNGIGYFEVPNARVVYDQDGQTRSFGIASMISWRGVWYVVHLGAVLRSSDVGVVDDPESGPGSSQPSSTC